MMHAWQTVVMRFFPTNFTNKLINYFSMDTSYNASLLHVFSAAQSIPYGICQAELALLVMLMENESEIYQLTSRWRHSWVGVLGGRSVHVVFWPFSVRQNGNIDVHVCVINKTNDSSPELMILSSSRCRKGCPSWFTLGLLRVY